MQEARNIPMPAAREMLIQPLFQEKQTTLSFCKCLIYKVRTILFVFYCFFIFTYTDFCGFIDLPHKFNAAKNMHKSPETRKIDLSLHAQKRSQQRGVSLAAIELVVRFGTRVPAGGGCNAHRIDKRALRKISRYHGGLNGQMQDKMKNLEVVTGTDGTVLTTLHRTKRRFN